MENNFENQVRKILQEESVEPSPATWNAIEKRLPRQKSDKRILWLVMFAVLCISFVVWYGLYDSSEGLKEDGVHPALSKKSGEALMPDTAFIPEINGGAIGAQKEESNFQNPPGKKSIKYAKESKHAERAMNEILNSYPDGLQAGIAKKGEEEKQRPIVKKSEPVSSVTSDSADLKGDERMESQIVSDFRNEPLPDSTLHPLQEDGKTDVLKKTPNNNKPSSKWQVELSLSAGAGALAEGLEFGARKLNMSPSYSPSNDFLYMSPGQSYFFTGAPSMPQNSILITAGMRVRKMISEKTFFFTGMEYTYYSNSIMIGSQRTDNIYSSVGLLSTHQNKYHFIEVPVGLGFLVTKIKNSPIKLNTGITLSQMVSADNMHYDKGFYQRNASALNHFQIGAEAGLSAIIKNRITVGPFYKYRLSSFAREGVYADKHLWYGGLRFGYALKNNSK